MSLIFVLSLYALTCEVWLHGKFKKQKLVLSEMGNAETLFQLILVRFLRIKQLKANSLFHWKIFDSGKVVLILSYG